MRNWAVLLLVAACGHDQPAPLALLAGDVRVSGASPFSASCVPAGQRGTNFSSSEVEPRLAIDPLDPSHFIAVWQQDRWSNGGSNGLVTGVSFDGGKTWTKSAVPYTACSGGVFQRASDPWVSFAPDGTAHQIGFGFDNADGHAAMLASRSTDGGRSWSAPITLFEDTSADFAIDKESITADPLDSTRVYAIWDRLSGDLTPGATDGRGPAWFTRSTDAGQTWETARIVYDPGQNQQTISNQIVVLPDGTLVDLLVILRDMNQRNSPADIAVLRSTDKGDTWSAPIIVSSSQAVGVVDPKQPTVPIRSGDIVPDIAVDRQSGALYVAWEDARFSGGSREGIAVSASTNGGISWSPQPVQANGAPATQAFTPVLAAANGKVALLYYDLRNDNPGDDTHVLATSWLAISSDGGATFTESAASQPFDIRTAPRTDEGYFLGDYEGIVPSGATFVPFFAIANDGVTTNRTDMVVRPAAELAAPRRNRAGGRRVF